MMRFLGRATVVSALAMLAACDNSAPPQATSESGSQQKTDPMAAPPDVAAAPADAIKTPSGLAYKILTKGTGTEHPNPTDQVSVHYSGWTPDGKLFDSSYKRNKPTSFALNQVIPGWTEGVALMVQGDKARFWIPANLAYGEQTAPGGPPAGNLVFDVELLSITKGRPPRKRPPVATASAPDPTAASNSSAVSSSSAPIPSSSAPIASSSTSASASAVASAGPAQPAVPIDVSGPPATAKRTPSGLAFRVLEKGKGTRHPKATDTVQVHYSGWTTDGKMFDSSVVRGEPAEFPLDGVIKGWTEGVQLMVEGEKTRFWIPANLAYGDKPRRGAPAGMLVFDIELIKIR
ncbi:MAG: FKBP-type peptidyl-prolyl cis-trans isomerase [Polyangiaceae bacterium]